MAISAQGGGETFTCGECGKTLPTEQELERHIASEHGQREVPEDTGGGRTEGGAGMVQSE
jgi:uncharacterized C2H2 Zn-finger protein